MWATSEESSQSILGLYQRACAHADVTITQIRLDSPGAVAHWSEGDRRTTLGAMVAYMLWETADKQHRGQGVVMAGLAGALGQIAGAGGGLVEAISETTSGRDAQSRFLFSATAELFEEHGFARGRQVGKRTWIVSRQIDPRDRGQWRTSRRRWEDGSDHARRCTASAIIDSMR